LRALWLENNSGLTLDGGSFSVLEQETFAGEGILDPIRPGEKRLVSYAVDLGLTATSQSESRNDRVSRVRVVSGALIHHSESRYKKSYIFRNEDLTPRSVIVEHPVRAGYALRGDAKPVETSAGSMRFRVEVPSKQTVTLDVEEAQPAETGYAIGDLTVDQIDDFVREKYIPQELEQSLRRIQKQKAVVADLEERKGARDEEMERIFNDQERLRENLKALKGSAEEKALVQRYTQQLNAQETRLEELRAEAARLAKEQEAAQQELSRLIDGLSFDVRL
jgi:acyl-CoA hydrolase